MVEAGITDILLTYNVIGQIKLDRLVALAHRADIKVVADCAEWWKDYPPPCPAPASLCRSWSNAIRERFVAV